MLLRTYGRGAVFFSSWCRCGGFRLCPLQDTAARTLRSHYLQSLFRQHGLGRFTGLEQHTLLALKAADLRGPDVFLFFFLGKSIRTGFFFLLSGSLQA